MANEDLSRNLAENVLALRVRRNFSQQQLARLAGIPRSTLTYIESGQGNPSLYNLSRLSSALQVSLEELLAAPRPQCLLRKFADLPVSKRAQGRALVYGLLPDPLPGLQLERMEIEVGSRIGGIPHLSGTKEYFTCVQGMVTIVVAGESFTLSEGDVLAFPGDQPHSYRNDGAKKAMGLSVVALGG